MTREYNCFQLYGVKLLFECKTRSWQYFMFFFFTHNVKDSSYMQIHLIFQTIFISIVVLNRPAILYSDLQQSALCFFSHQPSNTWQMCYQLAILLLKKRRKKGERIRKKKNPKDSEDSIIIKTNFQIFFFKGQEPVGTIWQYKDNKQRFPHMHRSWMLVEQYDWTTRFWVY